ncbi:hypothetical protein EVAR_52077_1 [Eumeta japonica]|uniref:Uncharacterized protein n=1 Tax=Eumeta variegata TaxID=151549 RepID=A0A4C1Y240_EUMVA|nr:hypothetical protein EVAR_52077_1 [Eumeta japonica]
MNGPRNPIRAQHSGEPVHTLNKTKVGHSSWGGKNNPFGPAITPGLMEKRKQCCVTSTEILNNYFASIPKQEYSTVAQRAASLIARRSRRAGVVRRVIRRRQSAAAPARRGEIKMDAAYANHEGLRGNFKECTISGGRIHCGEYKIVYGRVETYIVFEWNWIM